VIFRRVSDVAWRFVAVLAALIAVLWLIDKLKVAFLPFFVALLIATLLTPIAVRLEQRGAKPLIATLISFGIFFGTLTALGYLVAPRVTEEFGGLSETVAEGISDIETWLVDGPLDLKRDEIDEYESEVGDQAEDFLRNSSSAIAAGAVAVLEGVAGVVLSLVLAFFFVKDGRKFQRWAVEHLPPHRVDLAKALGGRAWRALGSYLQGAALLGLLEGIALAIAVAAVGGSLAVPVGVLTFVSAFFPIAGAVVAGLVAVLVALVTAGVKGALVVAIVALVVQQFDNDLLAPIIYGRIIRLHPALILISLTLGGTVGGIMGAFLAVPFAAVASAVLSELWDRYGEDWKARRAAAAAAAALTVGDS
jgi:predicted PurR-regulated permease PerM